MLETELFQVVESRGWEAAAVRFRAQLEGDDPQLVPLRHLVRGWVAVENTRLREAAEHFSQVETHERFGGLARVGEALLALRMKDFAAAEKALALADGYAAENSQLAGLIAHVRGTKAAHLGDAETARGCLYRAVLILGENHHAYGRALDTLGNLYLNHDNFLTARLLFSRALECKARVGDRHGMAVTHGQLGRLFLNWGYYSKAEYHFLEDLRLAEELNDSFGQTRMHGALGQVSVYAAREAFSLGRHEATVEHCRRAVDWLTVCVQGSQHAGFGVSEGFARKDLALVHLLRGDPDAAAEQSTAARALFAAKQFAEGLTHVDRIDGLICAARKHWDDAKRLLQSVLAYFVQTNDPAEAAITRLELARLAIKAGEPGSVIERALQEALRSAEACRRTSLVREVQQELRTTSPAAYWSHMFQRVRGLQIHDQATSFVEGTREIATVFFLDLQCWSNFAHGRDPEEVMMTINQIMSDAAEVLRRRQAQCISWRGDGFLAFVRGSDHAARAVETGLDLVAAIAAFNEPRRLLGLHEFQCRIGISTGEVLLGNVGTYEKMDYTGVGSMMNLGARLEAGGEVSRPCISQSTYELVTRRFQYAPGNPRKLDAKGIGAQLVWDVIGRTT